MNAPVQIRRPSVPARVAADGGRYKLRIEDYLLLDQAGSFGGEETELVDGDVIVMSPEWMPHMRIKDEIAYALRRAIETLGVDLRVGTGGSVQLSDTDQPRPDVIVMRPVSSDRAVPLKAVILLVEVSASTLQFDLNGKGPLYARFGIPEYWTVDVQGRCIHRWSCPTPTGYSAQDEVSFGRSITSAAIDGLEISTSGL
jgi:Uma2 family endonuclease